MNKTTRNLLIAFVALAAVYFLFFRSKEKVNTDKDLLPKFFTADSSKIEKIEIIKNGQTIALEKQGAGIWKMTKPLEYAADTTAIVPMLGNLQNYRIESLISSNPEKFKNYLDSTGNTQVNVYQEGKMVGSIIIGKQSTGLDGSYVMKPDENKIYLATNFASYNFTKALKDYRNKTIIQILPATVKKIELKSTDSNKVDLTLRKDSTGKWYIGADTVTKTTVDGFLNTFANWNTDTFQDSAITQFPTPTYSITLNTISGTPTAINFYKQNTNPPEYVAQVSGVKQLFKFSEGYAGMYFKKRTDFIPPPPKK